MARVANGGKSRHHVYVVIRTRGKDARKPRGRPKRVPLKRGGSKVSKDANVSDGRRRALSGGVRHAHTTAGGSGSKGGYRAPGAAA